ncbi:MAG: hypothetical protein LBI38_03025 [Oscillospiraceae bacterium]|jgi:hypothetical protein|nr:hypothetical protein [Oscillospiraceae bacterium]
MTLVEVLIATVIFALILVAVFTMYQPILKVSEAVKSDSETQRITASVEGFIIGQLRNSAEIEVYWSGDASVGVMSAGDWDAVKPAIDHFVIGKYGAGGNPQALLVKRVDTGGGDMRTYVYNVRLEDGMNFAELIDKIKNGDIEEYRVFNRSYYNDVELAFEIAISPSKPGAQVRNKTYLQMQVDALRDGELVLDSRLISDTQFTWIGNIQTPDYIPEGSRPIYDELRAKIVPPIDDADPDDLVSGEFIILYYNSAYYNR